MARVRKYLKGAPMSLNAVITAVLDRRYVFFNDKPMHPGWVGSWSLHLLNILSNQGQLYRANLNPAWVAPKEPEE